jgi:hypothetical protein
LGGKAPDREEEVTYVNGLYTAAQNKIDKAYDVMFSLSTGALALSVTFRGSIAPAAARELWLLSVAWLGFAVCSISYVIGLLLASSVDLELTKKLNGSVERLHNSSEPPLLLDNTQSLLTPHLKARIVVPPFVMSFSFTTAVVAFLVFALVNNA